MQDIHSQAYERIASALKNNATTSLEDTLFINRESRNFSHVAHLAKVFGTGFISHPESWWATNIQILAYLGYFGKHQQHHAIIRQSIFSSLLGYGFHHPVRTGRLLFWFKTDHVDEVVAALTGRLLGAKFITNKVRFNDKYSALPNTKWGNRAKFILSFTHSSYGLGMLSIAKGVRSLENLIFSMVTGNLSVLDGRFYSSLDNVETQDNLLYQEFEEAKPFIQSLLYFNTSSGYQAYANQYFKP